MLREISMILALTLPGTVALAQTASPVADIEVYAPQSSEFPSMAVSYADLRLDNQAGAHTLVDRLRFASQVVCDGTRSDRKDVNRWADYKKCYDTALRGAVAKLDNPLVAAEAHLDAPPQ